MDFSRFTRVYLEYFQLFLPLRASFKWTLSSGTTVNVSNLMWEHTGEPSSLPSRSHVRTFDISTNLHQTPQTWGGITNEANASDAFSPLDLLKKMLIYFFCARHQKMLQVFHNIAVTCKTLRLHRAVWRRHESDNTSRVTILPF